jgi:hypothetical protein
MQIKSARKPLMLVSALLLGIAACSPTTPRSVANRGVSGGYETRQSLNSSYYIGADPDYRPRGGKGGE